MARLSTLPRSSSAWGAASMETVLIDYKATTNPAVDHIASMLFAHDYRVSVYNTNHDADGSDVKDLDERGFTYHEIRHYYGDDDPIEYWANNLHEGEEIKYAIVDNFNDADKFACPTLVVGYDNN